MRTEEEYFTFVEQDGIDRRHAVLDTTANPDEAGYHGEVFDTVTGQTVWLGMTEAMEDDALFIAEAVLDKLENVNGFGSISLSKGWGD